MLEDMYAHAGSSDGRYSVMGKTFDAYRGYDLNKGLQAAEEKYRLAQEMGKEDYLYDARMNMAEALCGLGMFKESLEIMDGMDVGSVPGHLKAYYSHIYRTIYGLLADFAAAGSMRDRYLGATSRYRDSIVAYSKLGTLAYVVVKADGYNSSGDYAKAAELVEDYLGGTDMNTHDKAILHFTLSEAYRGMGDREKEKMYLALSATGDMESAVREYVSLRRLAVMLYEEGDIDRAYRYARLCMDDAARCNARWRILEVQKLSNRENTVLPVILVRLIPVLRMMLLAKRARMMTMRKKIRMMRCPFHSFCWNAMMKMRCLETASTTWTHLLEVSVS